MFTRVELYSAHGNDIQNQLHITEIARLEKLNQDSPEFAKFNVVEYSNTGRTKGKEWHFGYRIVPLTQPGESPVA